VIIKVMRNLIVFWHIMVTAPSPDMSGLFFVSVETILMIVLLIVHSEFSGTYRLYTDSDGFHYKDTLNGYNLVIVYLLFLFIQ
jgi:hypothetical protein